MSIIEPSLSEEMLCTLCTGEKFKNRIFDDAIYLDT